MGFFEETEKGTLSRRPKNLMPAWLASLNRKMCFDRIFNTR